MGKDWSRRNAKQTGPLQLSRATGSLNLLTWPMLRRGGEQFEVRPTLKYLLHMKTRTEFKIAVTRPIVEALGNIQMDWRDKTSRQVMDQFWVMAAYQNVAQAFKDSFHI